MDVIAQHFPQCTLQHMGCTVSTRYAGTTIFVVRGEHRVAQFQRSAGETAVVHVFAALVPNDVGHRKHGVAAGNSSVVSFLAAHFRIENRPIKDKDSVIAVIEVRSLLPFRNDGKDFAFCTFRIISDELGIGNLLAEFHAGPAQVAQSFPCFTGTNTLLFHQGVETVFIHCHAFISTHLNGEIQREAECIIETESVGTGEYVLPFCLVLFQQIFEDCHAGIDGPVEVLFLMADDRDDIVLLLTELGILALVLVHNGIHDLPEKCLVYIKQFAVACGSAHQATQDIAAALIGGKNTVADHKDGRTDMIGNDTERNVGLMIFSVVGTRDFTDLVGDVHHGVNIEERAHILADAGKTLKAHAGVDVLLLQLGVVVVAVIVKLGEDVVPDFDVTVAVAADGACGLAASKFLTAVIVDFRAGTAGACAVFPEIIFLAETEDSFRSDTDLFIPDIKSLIIILIDGGIETVRFQPDPFGRGQELPAPGYCLMLEIIPEGEVAQHLKIGAVACRLADVFNVAGADALLAGADSVAGRLFFASEVRLHGSHARVNQKNTGIILGNKREAGKAEMPFGFKKAEKHLAQFIQTVIRMHS